MDFHVETGEFVGLIGPNGAGKSTLIGASLGLVRLQEGEIYLFGDAPGLPLGKSRTGYLPEFFFSPDHLTPKAYLEEIGTLYGMSRREVAVAAKPLLERMGLAAHWDRPSGKLSKGLLRRLGIVRSLFHDPELLIFDEPAWGLDPMGRKALSEILDEAKCAGKSLVLSSHNMEMVEGVCDRYVFVDEGKVQWEATPEDLRVESSATIIYRSLGPIKGVDGTSTGDGRMKVVVAPEQKSSVLRALLGADAEVLEVNESRTELIDWVVERLKDAKATPSPAKEEKEDA